MIYLFSLIPHKKVAKIILSGEPDHFQPFGILLKGFLFYKLFSRKRRIFKKICSIKNVLNLKKLILKFVQRKEIEK